LRDGFGLPLEEHKIVQFTIGHLIVGLWRRSALALAMSSRAHGMKQTVSGAQAAGLCSFPEYLHESGDDLDLRRQDRSAFSHDLPAERHACVHCITFGVLHHIPKFTTSLGLTLLRRYQMSSFNMEKAL
jgi:hypothetical protein